MAALQHASSLSTCHDAGGNRTDSQCTLLDALSVDGPATGQPVLRGYMHVLSTCCLSCMHQTSIASSLLHSAEKAWPRLHHGRGRAQGCQ